MNNGNHSEYGNNNNDEFKKGLGLPPKYPTAAIQQLNQKINGYKSQDIHKKLLDLEKIVDLENVLQLLIQSNLECFYCKNKVQILYEHVREPLQWTLDRIDNEYGHNKGNLEIACLSCNVRRRTMYADRYVFTKQLKLIKKDG
jgi:5-methylcytosine-specific restriction endonuclease McrA